MLLCVRGFGLSESMHKCACLHGQPTVSGLRGVEEEKEEEVEEATGKSFSKKLKIARCLQALTEA